MKDDQKRSLDDPGQREAVPPNLSVIQSYVEEFVALDPSNKLTGIDDLPIFDQPLVGIADGDDSLFSRYKDIIGNFHLTPRQILEQAAGDSVQVASRIGVVCWALPFTHRIKSGNAKRDSWPSARWSQGTRQGEGFNRNLRAALERFFAERAILAVAPVTSPMWRRIEHLPGGHTSNWSERHALFAAGLGTFSLNDGFITERGMAMRCGSVVVNAPLAPTPRRYESHTENCLFFPEHKCGKCMDRCPANAITIKGHDKVRCREYRDKFFSFLHESCSVDITPGECGLCQTGVPCESRIPRISLPNKTSGGDVQ